MDAFLADILYAFRIFFKRPGLTLLAILALSVSLGMATTTFSVLNGMFFKPLPFKDPEGLHHIYLRNTKSEANPMPVPADEYARLLQLECFEDVMAYYSGTINLSGKGLPRRYDGAFVTANFLDLLGHAPVIGRSFSHTAGQPGGPAEILIGHDLWMERYHGDPQVLGTLLRANGADHEVVGVLPAGFHFPVNSHVWTPLNRSPIPGMMRDVMHVVPVARMVPGTTKEQAQAMLDESFGKWNSASIEEKDNLRLVCEPFGRMEMNRASRSFILATICAVIFILLVSCANVANLLVGRALTRVREMAIRSAVGATRRRIARQLLTESLVLSILGAVGGLLYAAWVVDTIPESVILEFPYWMSFELDWRVFTFAFAVMLATALISGLVPAWQASKTDLNEMLKDTSYTSTSFRLGRLTRMLAVVQIAFSCALLFGAGLVARKVFEMARTEVGYDKDRIFTMRMGLFPADYPDERERDAFYERLTKAVDDIPGVTSSSVTSWLGQFGNYKEPFVLPSSSDDTAVAYAYFESVSPGYFATFGLDALEGRLFSGTDTIDSQPVVVVNKAFADRYFPNRSPVGETLSMFLEKTGAGGEGPVSWRIVGVVPNVRVSNFTSPDQEEVIVYTPYTQTLSPFMTLAVHSQGLPTEDLQTSIQQVVLDLDPNLPLYFPKSMATFVNDQIYPFRMLADFFLIVGLMALFLAAIGVYGMLAFNVSRRRREIGIRMALGANTRNIVGHVLRQGFLQVTAGIVIGSGLAYVVGSLTRNFLLGVNPMDPSVYFGVLLTLIGVATLAFFIPARRAARLSPMEALRYE